MILGITGCPGSGKSVLAEELAVSGWDMVDADKLGKEVVESDRVMLERLADEFGQDILGVDGKLDRRLLAKRAFADAKTTGILNSIVHPGLIARLGNDVETRRKQGRKTVVDCALIFEWQIESMFDLIVCVFAEESIRKQRLMERDRRSSEDIEKIFNAQLTECEKITRADISFSNNGSVERLKNYGKILKELPMITGEPDGRTGEK